MAFDVPMSKCMAAVFMRCEAGTRRKPTHLIRSVISAVHSGLPRQRTQLMLKLKGTADGERV